MQTQAYKSPRRGFHRNLLISPTTEVNQVRRDIELSTLRKERPRSFDDEYEEDLGAQFHRRELNFD
jgi:hypothetical protein